MRRLCWWALVVGLAVLPFVVVVGHPLAVARWGRADVDPGGFVGDTVLTSHRRDATKLYFSEPMGQLGRPVFARWRPLEDEQIDAYRRMADNAPEGESYWVESAPRASWTLGYGWPFVSMTEGYQWYPASVGDHFPMRGERLGFSHKFSSLTRLYGALPTRVVWIGMIGNLAMVGAVWWATGWFVLFRLRRLLMRRRWPRRVRSVPICGG